MSRPTITPGDGDERHGTRNGYGNLGCRCTDCRDANTEWQASNRALMRDRVPPYGSHGKATTYTNWSCRCPDCTRAHADYERRRQASRRHTAGQGDQP
jgi:hypothetical protein